MLIIELVLSYSLLLADRGGGGQSEVSPDVTGVALSENHSCCGDTAHKTSCCLELLSVDDNLCPTSSCWKVLL